MQSRADQVCRAMRYKGDFLSLCKMQLQSSGLKWQKEWSLTRHGESPSFSAFWRQAERIRVCVSLPEEPVFFPNWCWVLAPSVFNFTGNISLQMTIIHAITLRQFTQLHITFITMFFFSASYEQRTVLCGTTSSFAFDQIHRHWNGLHLNVQLLFCIGEHLHRVKKNGLKKWHQWMMKIKSTDDKWFKSNVERWDKKWKVQFERDRPFVRVWSLLCCSGTRWANVNNQQ